LLQAFKPTIACFIVGKINIHEVNEKKLVILL